MFTDPHVQGYWRETYQPSWTDSQGRPRCGSRSDALNESHGDRRCPNSICLGCSS
jgi:hypothetical protein